MQYQKRNLRSKSRAHAFYPELYILLRNVFDKNRFSPIFKIDKFVVERIERKAETTK